MNKKEIGTVCITGSGRGLGYELIQSFLKDTHHHIAAVTRNGDVLKQKLGFPLSGNRVTVIEADISTSEGRHTIYNKIAGLPNLRCLIHNAGKLLFKPFIDITREELTDIYSINVFAPFLLTQKLIP